MTIGLSVTMRELRLQHILDAIDDGADEYDTAHLLIYAGPRPATGETVDEYDEVLADFVLSYPSGSITDAVLTFGTIADTLGLADDTATWARIVDCDGNFVMDLSVTSSSGNGDIKINTVDIEIGVTIQCLSASITEGNV